MLIPPNFNFSLTIDNSDMLKKGVIAGFFGFVHGELLLLVNVLTV